MAKGDQQAERPGQRAGVDPLEAEWNDALKASAKPKSAPPAAAPTGESLLLRENLSLKRAVNRYAVANGDSPPYPDADAEALAPQTLPGAVENLSELVDFGLMNKVFAAYFEVIGVPAAILDLEGVVLASSTWQRVCMQYHREHPVSFKRCVESDTELAIRLGRQDKYSIYRCKNGLTDCASPIIIEGKHIANMFVGQFFTSPPDMEFFEAQARELGFDQQEYLQAVREVSYVDEAKLPAILEFLVTFAEIIADLSIAGRRARHAQRDAEKMCCPRTARKPTMSPGSRPRRTGPSPSFDGSPASRTRMI